MEAGDPIPLPTDMHVRAGVEGIQPRKSRLMMVRWVGIQKWTGLGMFFRWVRNKCTGKIFAERKRVCPHNERWHHQRCLEDVQLIAL